MDLFGKQGRGLCISAMSKIDIFASEKLGADPGFLEKGGSYV